MTRVVNLGLRLQCRVCGLFFVQDERGDLFMTSEQRCQRIKEEAGESILAYRFTCPDCEHRAEAKAV